jgi:hypothetical protein
LGALDTYQKSSRAFIDLHTLLQNPAVKPYLQSDQVKQTLASLSQFLMGKELEQKANQLVEQIIEQIITARITHLKTKANGLTSNQRHQITESIAGEGSCDHSNQELFRGICDLVYPIAKNEPFTKLIDKFVPMD